jgi:DNA-binding CsgD family transcriptional regulator
MDAPPVQYVTTSDGYSIAYAVSGSGTPFVFLPGTYEHVQLAWQYPVLHRWLELLSERFQLIQLDERGTGMSTRGLSESHTFDDYLLDIEAVVDRLNLAKFILYGAVTRAKSAVKYTLNHVGRVSALVLGPTVVGPEHYPAAFFQGLPAQNWDLFLGSLAGTYRDYGDPAEFVKLLRQSFEQKDFLTRMNSEAPLDEDALRQLAVPTLVLHPRDYAITTPAMSMETARLTRATFSLIEGSFALGDAEQGVRAIERFLADLPQRQAVSASPAGEGLSSREVEVLRLLAAGKSNAQIADELVISQNTVIRHVSNIFAKIGAANRAEAASYATRHGLT